MSLLATTWPRLLANSRPARVIAVTAAAALTSSAAFAQTFANLGVLNANHQFSQAVAVSGNGQRVAGNCGVGLFDQMRGFRSSQCAGLTDMGIVPGVDYVALGIGNDGSAITGDYQPVGGRARRSAPRSPSTATRSSAKAASTEKPAAGTRRPRRPARRRCWAWAG